MAFQESAESWRSKAHLSGVKPSVVAVVSVVVVLVLLFIGFNAWNMFHLSSFEITSNSAAEGSGEEVIAGDPPEDLADTEKEKDETSSAKEGISEIVVHVGGAVVSSGVYRLDEGDRVEDAVSAAGGFAEGAAIDSVNLARVVVDGEQVIVPTLEEIATGSVVPQNGSSEPGGGAGGSSPTSSGKININTASAAELTALSGIGEVTAQKIVAERESVGPFSSPEDIMRVSGIGEKKYAQIADSICV